MPATISSTTDGNRTRGNRPSRNGTAKATATTMRRLLKDGMRQTAASEGPVTLSAPVAVSTNVSSAFAPVIDGFHAKA